jgi:hypothetical protein
MAHLTNRCFCQPLLHAQMQVMYLQCDSRIYLLACDMLILLVGNIHFQQINIQVFIITQWYIYYGITACFSPYFDHHQAIV